MNLSIMEDKLSSYLLALRPWSLSASLIPTLLGCALSVKLPVEKSQFSWIILLVTLLTVISVHCAGNVVNTYYDYVLGIDTSRRSDDRTLVDHILSESELVSLGVMLYLVSSAGFIFLSYLSPAKMEHLAAVFFCGLSSSFLYSGCLGLKYTALGDVLILMIFGPITVLFAFMSQSGHWEWATICYALPVALNTEAILHSNNTRDLDSDRQVGIVTVAILLGKSYSHVYYAFLLFIPYIVFVVWGMNHSYYYLLPLVTIKSAFNIERQFRCADKIHLVPKLTAKLNLYFGFLYVVAVSLA